MSHFTEAEIAYLQSQRLGRFATTGADGAPHVVPVVFTYNPANDSIEFFGANLAASKKTRDIQRDPRVAFVIDDVLPPWQARGIEIRGTAAFIAADGSDPAVTRDIIRITPTRIIAWGIDTDSYVSNSRSVQS